MDRDQDTGGRSQKVKERPILFSTDMVKAILKGHKTVTRRVIKNADGKPIEEDDISWTLLADDEYSDSHVDYIMDFSKTYPRWKENKCPYGEPGDILYVRETWGTNKKGETVYRADHSDLKPALLIDGRWKPSIHMPKKASRIWLRVNDVRVERLQDISVRSIPLEGIDIPTYQDSYGYGQRLIEAWINLWDSINADRGYGWETNPYVWVVDFEVISTNGKPEQL